jgi:hypothetical protein
MNEAARLRAQKAYSTDPDYLELMALAEEARALRARPVTGSPAQPETSAPPRRARPFDGN